MVVFHEILTAYTQMNDVQKIAFSLRFPEFKQIITEMQELKDGNILLDVTLHDSIQKLNKHIMMMQLTNQDNPFNKIQQPDAFLLCQKLLSMETSFSPNEIIAPLLEEGKKCALEKQKAQAFSEKQRVAIHALKKAYALPESKHAIITNDFQAIENNSKKKNEKNAKCSKLQMELYNLFISYDKEYQKLVDKHVLDSVEYENETLSVLFAWIEYLRNELRSIFIPENDSEDGPEHILEAVTEISELFTKLPKYIFDKNISNIGAVIRQFASYKKYFNVQENKDLLYILQKYHSSRKPNAFENLENLQNFNSLCNSYFALEDKIQLEEYDVLSTALRGFITCYNEQLYLDPDVTKKYIQAIENVTIAFQAKLFTLNSLSESEKSCERKLKKLEHILTEMQQEDVSLNNAFISNEVEDTVSNIESPESLHKGKKRFLLFITITSLIIVLILLILFRNTLFHSFKPLEINDETTGVATEKEENQITVLESSLQLNVGDSITLHPSGSSSYSFKSSNEALATVSDDGIVTALDAGVMGTEFVTITVTSENGTTAKSVITILGKVDYQYFEVSSSYGTTLPQLPDGSFQLSLFPGETVTLYIKNVTSPITWNSNNPDFIKVSADGTIEKLDDSEGSATITANFDGITLTVIATNLIT